MLALLFNISNKGSFNHRISCHLQNPSIWTSLYVLLYKSINYGMLVFFFFKRAMKLMAQGKGMAKEPVVSHSVKCSFINFRSNMQARRTDSIDSEVSQ